MWNAIIIPVAVAARELEAKLLLSCFLAEKGIEVYIGYKKYIDSMLDKIPARFYLSHRLRKNEKILKQNKLLFCIDEAGLVWHSKKEYVKRHVDLQEIDKYKDRIITIFCWGNEQKKLLKENIDDINLLNSSNPRIDLLKEVRKIERPICKNIKEKYGDFLLINTNFGWLNSILYDIDDYFSKSHFNKVLQKSNFERETLEYKFFTFQYFLDAIKHFSKNLDLNIIIRPHPSEKIEFWKSFKERNNLGNVHIHFDDNYVDWICSAKYMIHNSCTSAIEYFILGKIPIHLESTKSKDTETNLPRRISYILDDYTKIIDAMNFVSITDHSSYDISNFIDVKKEILEENIEGHDDINFISSRLISDIIYDHMNNNPSEQPLIDRINFLDTIIYRADSFYKRYIKYNSDDYSKIMQRRFNVTSQQILNIIKMHKSFMIMHGYDPGFHIDKINNYVYKISNTNKN